MPSKVQLDANTLYQSLCLSNKKWFSENGDFIFLKYPNTWMWIFWNNPLEQKAQTLELQTGGFQSRKHAAQYIDNIFDTNLCKTKFWRNQSNEYTSKKFGFQIVKKPAGWAIRNRKGYLLVNNQPITFSTRKKLLEHLVANHPDFIDL